MAPSNPKADSSRAADPGLGVSTSGSNPLEQSQSQRPQVVASKRWTYFYSALQLAIQRTAHKWTFEDFAECFETWCKDDPVRAKQVFGIIARHLESNTTSRCNDVLEQYNAQENIDILDEIIAEAKTHYAAGDPPPKDAWRENLAPRAAVRARTIPILRKERDALKAELAQLEEENLRLQTELQENTTATEENDREESRRLDMLDELHKLWMQLPTADIQEWTLQTAETIPS